MNEREKAMMDMMLGYMTIKNMANAPGNTDSNLKDLSVLSKAVKQAKKDEGNGSS